MLARVYGELVESSASSFVDAITQGNFRNVLNISNIPLVIWKFLSIQYMLDALCLLNRQFLSVCN